MKITFSKILGNEVFERVRNLLLRLSISYIEPAVRQLSWGLGGSLHTIVSVSEAVEGFLLIPDPAFNAALVIFSCILMEITSAARWTPSGPTITMAESLDTAKITDMITRLRRAAETLQRFGEGTKSAKRIRKTLLKLVQICMTLVQCNPEHGPTILTALASMFEEDVARSHAQQNEILVQNMGQEMEPGVMMGNSNSMLPMLPPPDPFTTYDINMHQYWTDTNLDLFNDLVGVESGLTSLMAG